ncbi:MAG TPA: TolC family protein, partial [Oligoflexia bacterium]|nr:TolC family protein [Oligoflexia bacterium]
LGIPPAELGARMSGASGIPQAPKHVAAGIPGDLLRRRPDVRYAELQAAAQSSRIGLTKAELYPSFSIGGNFGVLAADTNGSDLGDLFSAGSKNAVFGPSFQWNLLNYGQITNAVRVQDALFQEAAVNYENTVLLAQREVEDELVSFVKGQDLVRLLGEAAQAAKKTVELSKIQYDGGATDYTTVINAQAALLEQEDALARARGSVPQALIGVYRALGGGWELGQTQDFVPEAVKEEMRRRTDWGALMAPVPAEDRAAKPGAEVVKPAW